MGAGQTSRWPVVTGRRSATATNSSSSWTKAAGAWPEPIAQKTHSPVEVVAGMC